MTSILEVYDMRIEHLREPVGLDVRIPRFSWRIRSERPGARQASYRLRVSTSPYGLFPGDGDVVWDSGPVASEENVLVDYGGPPLGSGRSYDVTLIVWDQNGSSARKTTRWETGLLEREDWEPARWIQLPRPADENDDHRPSPYFRRIFHISEIAVQGRLYITAAGLYKVFVNGARVGDAELTPGWTDYERRISYQTYDVTRLLQSGENEIGLVLADGWFAGYVGWERRRALWGEQPLGLARLDVRLADDTTVAVVTNRDWEGGFGAIRSADIYNGEIVDHRVALNWMQPWPVTQLGRVREVDGPRGRLVGQRSPFVPRDRRRTPGTHPRGGDGVPNSYLPRQSGWLAFGFGTRFSQARLSGFGMPNG